MEVILGPTHLKIIIGLQIIKEVNEEKLAYFIFCVLNQPKSGLVQVEEELKAAENLSIQDYIRESQNIASLHHQIVECDQVGWQLD